MRRDEAARPDGIYFKIKLANGRILGPLDVDRIRRLLLKNQITGTELGRAYPTGEWKDINQIPEIATLIVARAQGKLTEHSGGEAGERPGGLLGGGDGFTVPLGATQVLPGAEQAVKGALHTISDLLPAPSISGPPPQAGPRPGAAGPANSDGDSESRTLVTGNLLSRLRARPKPAAEDGASGARTNAGANAPRESSGFTGGEDESTRVMTPEERRAEAGGTAMSSSIPSLSEHSLSIRPNSPEGIASQETIIFQRGTTGSAPVGRRRKLSRGDYIKATILALVLGTGAYETFLEPPSTEAITVKELLKPIRPKLPDFREQSDPELSVKLFNQGLKDYLPDNVIGYKRAAEKFRKAAMANKANVKALAFLASTYINLIDSSNKDENYFYVITKLIELSRAQQLELPETVIADVEFYITVNKPEAAESRIVEYTRKNANFGSEMFYYLGLAYYHRGNIKDAAKFISQITDNQAFSPKVFYLSGLISEALHDREAALSDYEKALKMNRFHAKSRLRIAELNYQAGTLRNAAGHLDFIERNPSLLSPKELARAHYLHSQLSQQLKQTEVALGDMERAIQLDRENQEYLLEYYTLRGKAGDNSAENKKDAKMFYFLGEGERALRAGKYQEALTDFLEARQANNRSPLPFIKIGDMFIRQHDLGNARENYQLAAQRAPNNIEVWTKYIDTLIQSYEWEAAEKAMANFRKIKNADSSLDKANGDMYAKRGLYQQAEIFYKTAMSREVIDQSVYLAYAKMLLEKKDFSHAPLFFALALRFDPFNTDALIGTAKCVAETDSIDRAISLLQDELQKGTGAKAELLAGIAELYIKRGLMDKAQEFVDQALAANPDYPYPWKLQGQIFMSKEGNLKDALDRALFAYQAYSERNLSDPSGYLERYRIFARKTEYDKADDELRKIFAIYPKYPGLHYYTGLLKAIQSNFRSAVEEFQKELKNNPDDVATLLQLGRALVEVGKPTDALAQYRHVMELSPQSAEAKQEAGFAHYILKNYSTAVALFNAALVYDPANPLIYKRLGMAYRELGDNAKASQAFRKYLEMEPDAPDKAQFLQYR